MDEKTIIIVSGLPRSGTSMMMKMLESGGLEIVTDNLRTADDDVWKYPHIRVIKIGFKNIFKSVRPIAQYPQFRLPIENLFYFFA